MKVPVEKILQYNKWKMKNDADNMNSYGGCVFRYAEQWTELMEKEIDGNEDETELFQKLVYCAEELSFLADTEGVTGAQHGMARKGVSWNNKSTETGFGIWGHKLPLR